MKNQPVKAIRFDCSHCDAAIFVIPVPDSPYPVKLPAHCPCCLTQIFSYVGNELILPIEGESHAA